MRAATATAEPPLEPPGVRVRSHGFFEGPSAEFSVDDPIANSSRLVLPMMMAPAFSRRSTTVASYGGTKPARIFEDAVVGTPAVHMLSLIATGTPWQRANRRGRIKCARAIERAFRHHSIEGGGVSVRAPGCGRATVQLR